jgi:GT2 family glycosyltransferase/glycosyltransferase involved in cell wall biosynthesis
MPTSGTGPVGAGTGEQPHVAAIVLNWNGRAETLDCLRSVMAAQWPRLSMIVVDNASEQDIAADVALICPEAHFIRNEANLGFAGGMNVGIRAALALDADYMLLLNNDVRLDHGLPNALLQTARAHPDAGIVCPLIFSRDRPDVILSAGLRCDLRRGHQGPPIGAGERDHGQYAADRIVDAPAGAAMLVPAEAARRAGMLDEELFLYGEDVEWAQRMREHGLRVYVTGQARLWHGVSVSSGGANSPLSAYYLTRNALTVSARYRPLHGPAAALRAAEILGANLWHARRSTVPRANVRAVLAGWRHYHQGRLGPCPPGILATPSAFSGLSAHGPARAPAGGTAHGTVSGPATVLSAGFDKTHMTTAARAGLDRGWLALAITGAYPTPRLTRAARWARLTESGRVARLLDRDEGIAPERLRAFTGLELLYDVAKLAARLPELAPAAERLSETTWRIYGARAGHELKRLSEPSAAIYHYRAGYGQSSIGRARKRNMHVLCDHAIAHPVMLERLVPERGAVMAPAPDGPGGARRPALARPRQRLNRAALRDIENSDSVLVNSRFVKQTFLDCGWPAERVHVIYLGVDDGFLGVAPNAPRRRHEGPLRLMFAGSFERRKGADVLVDALGRLDGLAWELILAGPIAPEARSEHAAFLADPRVRVRGVLRRRDLAREMSCSPVFVFPSYAEGSARVVFEALACGCYVITTPNSGTIVQDGRHGALVAPGDAGALARALAAAGEDRARLAEIGTRNAALIRARYTQRHYADALAALYAELAWGLPSAPRARPELARS